jgi:hypothetical protein
MPIGAFTAARHLPINDDLIELGDDSYQDFQTIANGMGQQFTPQGIHVNFSSVPAQEAAGYAIVDGYLIGENESFRRAWRVILREPVGLAFARIYNSATTTARGISLLSEV